MERIIVYIDWCKRNFCGSFSENVPGGVVFAAATYAEILHEAQATLEFHMQGYVDDGEAPQWYTDHDYVLDIQPTAPALLHAFADDITLSAISRATGINQRLLSHYANGLKTPRPRQRQRIIDGIHSIGQRLLSV